MDNIENSTKQPPIETANNQPSQKPIWKTDAFTVLALVIFWPVGLFLMWKYTAWRKWVKGLLAAFFLIGAIPILLIWGLLFGLKGYSFVDNILHPRTVNQSQLYNCAPLNSKWARCTNTKYRFSFEYPANWNYIDLKPEGIGFSPAKENIRDNFIISMGSPSDWESEDKAKQFADGYFGISQRQKTTINSLYATKDYKAFTGDGIIANVMLVDGKMTYQFISIPDKVKEAGLTLSNNELQAIFDHMADSFVKEQ